MNDGSGPRWPMSFAQYDPAMSWWRTSQLSFEMGELGDESSLTFTPSGSMRSGRLYPRTSSAHRIFEIGCTSWPTPRATMAGIRTNPRRPGRSNLNLEEAVGDTGEGIGYLNPRWIEWLMGFPAGWCTTPSTHSETQSSRPSSNTSGSGSLPTITAELNGPSRRNSEENA